MSKPGISFIIQTPSPDLDSEEYEGNKIYIRGAVHGLDTPEDMAILGPVVPYEVLKLIRTLFNSERYRAEILAGDTLFKFYKKPSRGLVPKEEEGTKLELHKLKKETDPPGEAYPNDQVIDPSSGLTRGDILVKRETISGVYNGEEIEIQCIGVCLRPDFCLSRNACKLLAQKKIKGGAGSHNHGPIDDALAMVRPPEISEVEYEEEFRKCATDPGYLCPEECVKFQEKTKKCLRLAMPATYEDIRNGTEDASPV